MRIFLLLAGIAALASAAAPAAAQDSTAARVLRGLERLARPPAPDTASAVGVDSTLISAPGSLARPPLVASGDTILQRLLQLEGFERTRYEGLSASFEAGQRVLVLLGDSTARAAVRRQGIELTADSVIRFDEAAGRLEAEGHPVFTPQRGDPVESRAIVYDIESERGSALDATTRYSAGANWIVTGDLPAVSPDVVYASHASFTSCELTDPHYHFETDEIKIVGGNILVARPVRLYFADVPVAWLPFIAQSLASGRASGLLTPRFSVNDIVRTSGGYSRRISNLGFYWAVNDYMDATVAFDWFSGNFTSLTGSYRYRWVRQFLNGTVNARRYWRADGGTELAFDTNHDWQPDERTTARLSARFSSSTDFLRRNTFDPRELTRSITSSGGVDRRFDWGSVSLGGTRNQYLSDDRVTMTLPSLSLNLTPIRLLAAPPAAARWYNNVTWSGHASAERDIEHVAPLAADSGAVLRLDRGGLTGSMGSSFTMGNLSWSQRIGFDRASTFDVPPAVAPSVTGLLGYSPGGRALVRPGASLSALAAADVIDIREDNVSWNTSLSYQQTLVGSTTFTPHVALSGRSFRSDTLQAASSFVAAPSRLTFGAALKSDVFGFFGGVGPFSAIRHKLSPEISYDWSPEQRPTALQTDVFNSDVLQPTNTLRLRLNQTFEAKRDVDATADSVSPAEDVEPGAPGEPRRVQQAETVNLLSIRTDAVTYDFVEADSTGEFLQGFRTTQIGNSISSDFLRGLSIQMVHDLFRDSTVVPLGPSPQAGRRRLERAFAPHLSRVNLGFSLNNRSSIFRGFGLFGDEEAAPPIETDLPEETEPFDRRPATDETRIIPGALEEPDRMEPDPDTDADVGRWNANFSYSLVRPRRESQETSQMLQISFDLIPTEKWDLGWRTSYDLERGAFNDHMVSLSRDLHRWRATFDFTKTATGNWAFRFEVSLLDNRDLKFDYKQRNLEPPSRREP